MSNRLIVSAVQSDAQGETNCVWVSPSARVGAKFLKINGFIFSVREDPAIPDGLICMNSLQRKTARLTTLGNDAVDVSIAARDVPTVPTAIARLKLELSYLATSKTGGVIDYPALMAYLHSRFLGQFFTVSQQVLVVFEGQKFVAVAKEVDALQKGGGHDQAGVLLKDTLIVVECPERTGLQVINIPAEQLDAQSEQKVKSFDLESLGIGGLKKEFGEIFRRAFATRIYPQSIVKKLGVSHIKGVLLYGPPGTGKTLIARKIGEILNVKSVQVVNGPEVFNKWVGGAEENVRKLFAQAEEDQKAKGDLSPLHLIIFDEFDSIAKQRGGGGGGTNVGDNVVNQLLSKIDGVNQLNNILLIGATNRKDLLDEAILRPGRFEVHIEIGLPDEAGREEILKIHTRRMRENDALGKDVDIAILARETKNFSGAELRGLVDAASAHAFTRHIDPSNPTAVIDANATSITMADFQLALNDVKPAFGQSEDACKNALRRGIINYGPAWQVLDRRASDLANSLRTSGLPIMSVLVHGSGSSGKSAFAAHTAMLSDFPFVKFITNPPLVGYGELQKCNIVRRAFDDSYKSPFSVIVLDDLERLIEYSGIGGRYSNTLLQSLLVLIKNPPPDGRKLLVIATTSNRAALEQLELTEVFTSEIEMPSMEGAAVGPLSVGLHCEWRSPSELDLASASLPDHMPLKRLITVLEMAAEAPPPNARPGTKRVITYERFSEALLISGTR